MRFNGLAWHLEPIQMWSLDNVGDSRMRRTTRQRQSEQRKAVSTQTTVAQNRKANPKSCATKETGGKAKESARVEDENKHFRCCIENSTHVQNFLYTLKNNKD